MTPELSQNDQANPVASFETGLITVNAKPVGMCLKFRHYDGTDTLTHWTLPEFALLKEGLLEYINSGQAEGFMFKAQEDPALVASLPPRHPFHTLLIDRPDITEEEIGTTSAATNVAVSNLIARGSTLVLHLEFQKGQSKDIYMHEYTAFSLWGYLDEFVAAYDKLSGPSEGGIQ